MSQPSPRFGAFIHFSVAKFKKNGFSIGHELAICQKRKFEIFCAAQNLNGRLKLGHFEQSLEACQKLLSVSERCSFLWTIRLNARAIFILSQSLSTHP